LRGDNLLEKARAMIEQEASGAKIIKNARLMVSNNLRETFYSIWIESHGGSFRVRKTSGVGNKVWDRRVWEFSSLEEAEALFNRRIKEKTNPTRRSSRKYRIKDLLPERPHDGPA